MLIPSFLGMLFCVVMFIDGAATSTRELAAVQQKVEADLKNQDVPQAIVDKIKHREPISTTEMEGLKSEQQTVVQAAQEKVTDSMMTRDVVAGGVGKIIFICCVGVASFVSGLLGWLLVMRKKVLQCNRCEAIIAAS